MPLLPRDGRRGALTPEGERLAAALDIAFVGIAPRRRRADRRRRAPAAAGHHHAGLRGELADAAALGVPPRAPRGRADAEPDRPARSSSRPAASTSRSATARATGAGSRPSCSSPPPTCSSRAPSLIGERRIADHRDILDLPWLQELGTTEMSAWLRDHGVIADRKAERHPPARPPGARGGPQRRRRLALHPRQRRARPRRRTARRALRGSRPRPRLLHRHPPGGAAPAAHGPSSPGCAARPRGRPPRRDPDQHRPRRAPSRPAGTIRPAAARCAPPPPSRRQGVHTGMKPYRAVAGPRQQAGRILARGRRPLRRREAAKAADRQAPAERGPEAPRGRRSPPAAARRRHPADESTP